jgi:hypothetical protein
MCLPLQLLLLDRGGALELYQRRAGNSGHTAGPQAPAFCLSLWWCVVIVCLLLLPLLPDRGGALKLYKRRAGKSGHSAGPQAPAFCLLLWCIAIVCRLLLGAVAA